MSLNDKLILAVKNDDIELAKKLLADGAKASSFHDQAIGLAVNNRNLAMVRILVEHGGNVNKTLMPNSDTSLLLFHAKNKNAWAVELLLEAGADVDILNKEAETPLIWAALNGDVETIAVLLRYGADMNRVDKSGQSALDWVQGRDDIAAADLFHSFKEKGILEKLIGSEEVVLVRQMDF